MTKIYHSFSCNLRINFI